MAAELSRALLTSRYRITGRLVMETALHIGGGEYTSITDSPVVKLPTGEPFIPGSSIRGAFRAAVERLAPVVAPRVRTCALSDDAPDCLSAKKRAATGTPGKLAWADAYQVIRTASGRELRAGDDTSRAVETLHEAVLGLGGPSADLRDLGWPAQAGMSVTEDYLLALLEILLCDTCKTFGSVHLASCVAFHDLPVDGEWHDEYQVRDGVGIDRDSERAKPGIKFDFQVVPPDTAFAFSVTLESPSARDLALVALGLSEFMDGAIAIGGIRSRGLGRCRLETVEVQWVDLMDPKARLTYLISRTMQRESGEVFVARHLGSLMATGN